MIAVLAAASALVWPARAPAGFLTPDLPRDSVLILVGGVYAAVLVPMLEPPQPFLERLAVIDGRRLRGTVAVVMVGWSLALARVASLAMSDQVAAQFLRNVAVSVGITLLVVPISRAAALLICPSWAAASVAAGHRLVPGGPLEARWWAIPVAPGSEDHWVAMAALAAGLTAFVLLGSRTWRFAS